MKRALLGLTMVCAGFFTGCVSQKAMADLGANILEGTLDVALDPAFGLAHASNQFRVANHRWPRDYDELSSFLRQTHDRTYSSFQAVKFHRINFTNTTDGNLRIDADYTCNSAGKLRSGGTFSSNLNGRIDGMVVSPFDPQEMTSPSPQGGANASDPFGPETNRTSAVADPHSLAPQP